MWNLKENKKEITQNKQTNKKPKQNQTHRNRPKGLLPEWRNEGRDK